jgi:hypothetical protein
LISGWKKGDLELLEIKPIVELRKLQIQSRTSKAQLLPGDTPAAKGVALADKLHAEGFI